MNATDKKLFNKELMALAVPLALQNLLNALVGASDALMLGRLNQDAIAAVSLANQVSFVMSLFLKDTTNAWNTLSDVGVACPPLMSSSISGVSSK